MGVVPRFNAFKPAAEAKALLAIALLLLAFAGFAFFALTPHAGDARRPALLLHSSEQQRGGGALFFAEERELQVGLSVEYHEFVGQPISFTAAVSGLENESSEVSYFIAVESASANYSANFTIIAGAELNSSVTLPGEALAGVYALRAIANAENKSGFAEREFYYHEGELAVDALVVKQSETPGEYAILGSVSFKEQRVPFAGVNTTIYWNGALQGFYETASSDEGVFEQKIYASAQGDYEARIEAWKNDYYGAATPRFSISPPEATPSVEACPTPTPCPAPRAEPSIEVVVLEPSPSAPSPAAASLQPSPSVSATPTVPAVSTLSGLALLPDFEKVEAGRKILDVNGFRIEADARTHCSWHADDEYKTCEPVIEIVASGETGDVVLTKNDLKQLLPFWISEEVAGGEARYFLSQNYSTQYSLEVDNACMERLKPAGAEAMAADAVNAVEARELENCESARVSRAWTDWRDASQLAPAESFALKKGERRAVKLVFDLPKYAAAHYEFGVRAPSKTLVLDPEIDACGNLDTEGATYELIQNVSSDGTCFNVLANGITLDCKGYTINFASASPGYGVNVAKFENTTIQNCNVSQATPQMDSYGVYVIQVGGNSNGTVVKNNSFIALGNGITTNPSAGVYLSSVSNATIHNNSFAVYATSYGIWLYAANNNENLTNNSIAVNDAQSFDGIRLYASSYNNVSNNTVTVSSGTAAYSGIYLASDSAGSTPCRNNIVSFNSISVSANSFYGINLVGAPCSGALNCPGVGTQPECEACTQCSWQPTCGGKLDCTQIEIQEVCEACSQCLWNQLGFPPCYNAKGGSCTDLDPDMCDKQCGLAGCSWGSSGTCANNGACGSCATQGLCDNCGGLLGCSWTENYVHNNTIQNNSVALAGTSDYGIASARAKNNYYYNNTVSSSDSTDGAYGFYLNTESSSVLQDNSVTVNGSNEGEGIHLASCDALTVYKNVVAGQNNARFGVYAEITTNSNFSFNTVSVARTSGVGYGVVVSASSTSNNFTNNSVTASGSSAYGLFVMWGCTGNAFESNSITAGGRGIEINTDSNNFTNNTVTATGASGYAVDLVSSSSNVFTNNTLRSAFVDFNVFDANCLNNVFYNDTFNSSSYPTTASFTFTGVIRVNSTASPGADPAGYYNVSKYLNVSETQAGSCLGSADACPSFTDPILCDSQYGCLWNDPVCTDNPGHYPCDYAYYPSADSCNGNLSCTWTAYNTWVFLNVSYAASDLGVVNESSLRLWRYSGSSWSEVSGSNVDTSNNYVYANLTSFSDFAPMGNATSCGTLTTNTTLSTSVSADGTCFTIGAANVTLDCAGYAITYAGTATGHGVYNTGYENLTVKNCTITQNTTTPQTLSYGVYLSGETGASNGTVVENNTLTPSCNSYTCAGVYLYNSSNVTVYDNSFTTAQGAHGIWLSNSSNNENITLNTVTLTDSSSRHGVYLLDSSYNNASSNQVSVTSGESGRAGIELEASAESAANNIISYNTVTSTVENYYGIQLAGADSNNFTNNTLTTAYIDFAADINSDDDIVTNMTFNSATTPATASFTFWGPFSYVNSSESPGADASGYRNISKYLKANGGIGIGGASWVFLNVSYSTSDLGGESESKLRFMQYQWDSWSIVSGASVDTANNYVYGNVTLGAAGGVVVAPMILLGPNVSYVDPTPANGAVNYTNWIFVNVTSDEDLSTALLGWTYPNGTAVNVTMNSASATNWYLNFTGSDGQATYTVWGQSAASGRWNDASTNPGSRTVFLDFENVTVCRALYQPITYTLLNNVSGDNCLLPQSANMTVDCNGYAITFAASSQWTTAFRTNSYENITVENCVINQNTTTPQPWSYGVIVDGGSNGTVIKNNSITVNGDGDANAPCAGVYLGSSTNSTVYNNTVTAGASSYGIYLLGFADNNENITNNSITLNDASSLDGIWLRDSNYNNVSNNVITASNGASGYAAIRVYVTSSLRSQNNTFAYNTISTTPSGYSGIKLVGGGYCNGALNCPSAGSEPACTACKLCNWLPQCTGTLNCSVYSTEPDCNGCSQCTWNGTDCNAQLSGACSNMGTGPDCTVQCAAAGCGLGGTCNNAVPDCTACSTQGDCGNCGGGFNCAWTLNNNATNNTFDENSITVSGANAYGVYSAVALSNYFYDNSITASGTSSYAVFLNDSDSSVFTNNTLTNSATDFYSDENSSDNVATNTTFNSSSKPTMASFTWSGAIIINSSDSPAADPAGYSNVSRYLNVTNSSDGAWVFLNVSYADSDVPANYNESNVTLWRHNGAAWNEVAASGVNRGSPWNYSYANLTAFSDFAPMAGADSAVEIIDVTINCSTLNLGEGFAPGSANATAAATQQCNVTVYGNTNVAVDLSVNASDFIGGVVDLKAANVTVSNNSGAGGSCKTELSSFFKSGACEGANYTDWVDIPDPVADVFRDVFFFVNIPQNQLKETYAGTVYVKAVKH